MFWTSEATWHLLDLFKENVNQLRDAPKDAPIYQEMADQLVMFGPSAKEVRKKIKSLKKLNSTGLSEVDASPGTASPAKRIKKVKEIVSSSNVVDTIDLSSITTTIESLMASPPRASRKRRIREEFLAEERKKVKVLKALLVEIKNFHKTALKLLASNQ